MGEFSDLSMPRRGIVVAALCFLLLQGLALAVPISQDEFVGYALLESAGNPSFFRGTAAVTYDASSQLYTFYVATNMTEIQSAHVHRIADGSALLELVDRVVSGNEATQLRAEMPASMLVNTLGTSPIELTDLYIGLHDDIGGFEIEGDVFQVLDGEHFLAVLNAAQVTDSGGSSTSAGAGVGILIKSPTRSYVSTTCWTTNSTFDVAHIHAASFPDSGSPVVTLSGGVVGETSGCSVDSIAADVLVDADVDTGRYYYNVHTAAYPQGELRGQIAYNGASTGCSDGVSVLDGLCSFPQGFQLHDSPDAAHFCEEINGADTVLSPSTLSRRSVLHSRAARSLEKRHGGGGAEEHPCVDVVEGASASCLVQLAAWLCTAYCPSCSDPFPLNQVCNSACAALTAACSGMTDECLTAIDFAAVCATSDNSCSAPLQSSVSSQADGRAQVLSAILGESSAASSLQPTVLWTFALLLAGLLPLFYF